jgi:hypothetical protein
MARRLSATESRLGGELRTDQGLRLLATVGLATRPSSSWPSSH